MELSTTQNKVISLAKRLQKFLSQETQTIRQTKSYERNYSEFAALVFFGNKLTISDAGIQIDGSYQTWEDFIKEVKQGLHLN